MNDIGQRSSIAAGWISIGDDDRILASGALGDRVLGWSHDDLRGRSVDEVVHPDDHRSFDAARAGVAGATWEQELPIRWRSRDNRWVRVTATIRSVGHDVVVADLVDVSGQFTPTEGLDVLAELRRVIDTAEDIDDAWAAALDHLTALAGFRTGVWWTPRRVRGHVEWTRAKGHVGDELAAAVRIAATNDRFGWAHDLLDADPLSTPTALLFPVASRDAPVAVIELRDQDRLIDEAELALVGEVASQLGDVIERRRVDLDLALERERFELAFEQAAIAMMLVAPDDSFIRANSSCCDFFGRTEAELRRLGFAEITHPDDRERDAELVAQVLDGQIDTYQLEKRYLLPDGRSVWGLLSVSLIRSADGSPLHFVCQIQDIDRQRTAQAALERTVALFAAAFDGASTGMVLVGLDGDDRSVIAASNAKFRQLAVTLGHPRSLDRFDVFSPDGDEWLRQVGASGSEAYVTERSVTGPDDERWVRLSASPVRSDDRDGRYVILHVEDVTDQRQAQSELAYNALHDALTGLPNRALISERIRHAQERSERSGAHLGVLFLDLDNFKDVNDTLGHHAGDELLREVANRFALNIRPADTAARLGGDEFVILCEDLSPDPGVALDELAEVAQRIHDALDGPIVFAQGEGWVTASIGTEVVSGTSQSVATVLGNADVAMYRAKQNGRSRTEVFDAAMRRAAIERVHLAAELRRALEREQLWVAFQPIVRLPDGAVRGAEALLRWEHPELGLVPPSRFIDIAEESDLIVELGEFVVEAVCEALIDLPDLQYITMNVSARQLAQSDFAGLLLDAIDDYGIDPRRVAVELTENVLMDAGGSSLRQLTELRAAGLPIGVDDFGTGFASLTYLRRLPVTFVKIDKSFVDGILDDADDRTIVHGTIGLAHSLGLALVAEGVETDEQAAVLNALGCESGQGYHFGRPSASIDQLRTATG